MKIERDVALARHTTIGTGGPAGFFARPSSLDELREALAFAAGEGVPVEVIGLGSNVLVHDDGVDALVLRLEGELARVAVEDDVIVAGGERPTPSASTGREMRVLAASSSLRRSPVRSAGECG